MKVTRFAYLCKVGIVFGVDPPETSVARSFEDVVHISVQSKCMVDKHYVSKVLPTFPNGFRRPEPPSNRTDTFFTAKSSTGQSGQQSAATQDGLMNDLRDGRMPRPSSDSAIMFTFTRQSHRLFVVSVSTTLEKVVVRM